MGGPQAAIAVQVHELEGPGQVGMLCCVGAMLLPRELKKYGHDPKCRVIFVLKGQAALRQMGLAAVGHATHGTEVAPVQQDNVEHTLHHPRDQRDWEHAVGGARSAMHCHRL
jgi:hypothetical protein